MLPSAIDPTDPIDPALVETLVREQHPRLAAPVWLLAHGWDNDIFRLGEHHVVRLPRREEAVPLVENEQRWLPLLAGRLDVAVPAPVAAGRPGAGYPWPWSICPWFDGEPAATVAVPDRTALAEPLAATLVALHRPAPADAPRNPVRGVPLATRDAAVRQRLSSDRVPHARTLEALWDCARASPVWDGADLWIHGDLHPANLLVASGDEGPRIAAILDFGDLGAGDPATDLAAAWLFFDGAGRARFRALLDREAGTVPADWERARGWAVAMASAMLVGSPTGSPMIPIGERIAEELASDAG